MQAVEIPGSPFDFLRACELRSVPKNVLNDLQNTPFKGLPKSMLSALYFAGPCWIGDVQLDPWYDTDGFLSTVSRTAVRLRDELSQRNLVHARHLPIFGSDSRTVFCVDYEPSSIATLIEVDLESRSIRHLRSSISESLRTRFSGVSDLEFVTFIDDG